MITAEEALANHKRCVEDLRRRDGEYYVKYMTIIQNKINEANEKYGLTSVEWYEDFGLPDPVRDALTEDLLLLKYEVFIATCSDSTHFSIDWSEEGIKRAEAKLKYLNEIANGIKPSEPKPTEQQDPRDAEIKELNHKLEYANRALEDLNEHIEFVENGGFYFRIKGSKGRERSWTSFRDYWSKWFPLIDETGKKLRR